VMGAGDLLGGQGLLDAEVDSEIGPLVYHRASPPVRVSRRLRLRDGLEDVTPGQVWGDKTSFLLQRALSDCGPQSNPRGDKGLPNYSAGKSSIQ
jgi:hypothetical protein